MGKGNGIKTQWNETEGINMNLRFQDTEMEM